MRTKIAMGLLALLMGIFQTFSAGSQSDSMKALKRMKAKDYFEGDLQIRFAEAVANADEKKMGEILKEGADVNVVGHQEMRPLFWALCKQSVNGFKFLLENGADPNVQATNLHGETTPASVMELAAIIEAPEYLRLALKHGGNPNYTAGYGERTIIFEAILNHRIENVRTLVKAGADLNHRDVSGSTPLMTTVGGKQYDIMYVLLEAGADPAIRDRWGFDLSWMIKRYGNRGVKITREQREWHLKVVTELKRRGLME